MQHHKKQKKKIENSRHFFCNFNFVCCKQTTFSFAGFKKPAMHTNSNTSHFSASCNTFKLKCRFDIHTDTTTHHQHRLCVNRAIKIKHTFRVDTHVCISAVYNSKSTKINESLNNLQLWRLSAHGLFLFFFGNHSGKNASTHVAKKIDLCS